MTLPITNSEKLNIISDDLITYAFAEHVNDDDRMLIASLMLITAKMIYLKNMGSDGKIMYESDKEVILKNLKPTAQIVPHINKVLSVFFYCFLFSFDVFYSVENPITFCFQLKHSSPNIQTLIGFIRQSFSIDRNIWE